jgi:diguanylate cyclase (GGDEF)-like protein/PAS domain S-box-containing protein
MGPEGGAKQVGSADLEHGLGLEEALRLLRAVPHGVAVIDGGGRFAFVNDACARLVAWRDGTQLVGRSWREICDPEEAERLEREGLAPARAGGAWRGQATARRHDGVHVPLEVVAASLGSGRVALALRDVTEQRRTEERLSTLVYRDPLTGLPNRRLFEDRLAMALAQAHRYRHRLAVIFLDLDRFKQVNDTLGHAVGDALLKAVSERLADSVREGDTVARLAGDEFTMLLPGIHYAEDLAAISRKLVEALRRPFHLDGHDVCVTASGGIGLYPEDGEDPAALLKSADAAMYRAKERGRDNFQLFSPAMAEKALERRALEESLRRALDRQEMTVHYQPCLELATGRVVGVEALLRWQRPELGLLLPKDFIALADFTGAMLSVGPWVLETACRQAREWQRRGSRGLRVMVNLSAHELQQADLVVHVEKALAASGLDPDSLHLEIPEGYAMRDVDRAIEGLRALRSVGVHLAIDGFGAGFSSLAHLRRLPVDALKIDLSFVRGATTDPDDASVVTAVIAVAHSLGLRVVALGVETEAQVALLRSLGCDEVQGYLWSAPVPPEECERVLAAGVLPAATVRREGSRRGGSARGRGRR